MSSEETELTFIRCPSCRSLVPAVATRCRMCGHYFDGESAESAGEEAGKRRSRVRQRTLSVSKEEVGAGMQAPTDAKEFETHEEFSAPHTEETEPRGEEAPPASSPDEDEPVSLDRFRPRFAADSKPSWAMPRAVEEAKEEPSDEPELKADAELDPPPVERHIPWTVNRAPSWAAEKSAPAPVSPADDDSGEFDDEEDFLVDEDEAGEAVDVASGTALEEPRPGKKRRRRRKKRRHGGEVSGSAPEAGLPPASDHVPPPPRVAEEPKAAQHTPQPEPVKESVVEPIAPYRHEQPAETIEPQRAVVNEIKKENSMSTQESSTHENAFSRGAEHKPQGSSLMDDPGVSPQEEGTLLGWIVNYEADSKGMAAELRAGQFFIGRQRLRKNDMVIPDSAISTPHCLVAASRAEGLKIQDLMSEQGTFIKRRGKDSFVRVRDVIVVEHGDTVRFGGYEVLICLVPGTGRK